MLKRVVEPEILDSLPHDHPDALRNRRDILRINQLAGSFSWFKRQLQQAANVLPPGALLIEIGAGDGSLGRRIAQVVQRMGWRYAGVDFAPRPPDWPASWEWRQSDARSQAALAGADGLLSNLLLHQFEDAHLREIGRNLPSSIRWIAANEPQRSARGLVLTWLLSPIMNRVSRHDARVSVRAGFRAGELPELLGLDRGRWEFRAHATARAMYRLEARHVTLATPLSNPTRP